MLTETILWLFPCAFMAHEFEEIIGFQPWLERNRSALLKRFPRGGRRILARYDGLSTSAFTLAVAEEFALLVALMLLTARPGWYDIFAAIVVGYLIHVLGHVGQFLLWRRYIPCIVTAVLTAPYGVYLLVTLGEHGLLHLWPSAIASLILTPLLFANIAFALWLAARFEAWLRSSR